MHNKQGFAGSTEHIQKLERLRDKFQQRIFEKAEGDHFTVESIGMDDDDKKLDEEAFSKKDLKSKRKSGRDFKSARLKIDSHIQKRDSKSKKISKKDSDDIDFSPIEQKKIAFEESTEQEEDEANQKNRTAKYRVSSKKQTKMKEKKHKKTRRASPSQDDSDDDHSQEEERPTKKKKLKLRVDSPKKQQERSIEADSQSFRSDVSLKKKSNAQIQGKVEKRDHKIIIRSNGTNPNHFKFYQSSASIYESVQTKSKSIFELIKIQLGGAKEIIEEKSEATQQFEDELQRYNDIKLKEARYWIIFNYFIFMVVATSFHYFRWTTMELLGRLSMIIVTTIQFLITLGLILSYFKSVKVVYQMIMLQSTQFLLFNLLHFSEVESFNFQLLNMFISIFSTMNVLISLAIFLSLTQRVIPNIIASVISISFLLVSILINQGFNVTPADTSSTPSEFQQSTTTDIIFIIIHFLACLIFALFISWLILSHQSESKLNKISLFDLSQQLRSTFDHLQEGCLILTSPSDATPLFVNSAATRVLHKHAVIALSRLLRGGPSGSQIGQESIAGEANFEAKQANILEERYDESKSGSSEEDQEAERRKKKSSRSQRGRSSSRKGKRRSELQKEGGKADQVDDVAAPGVEEEDMMKDLIANGWEKVPFFYIYRMDGQVNTEIMHHLDDSIQRRRKQSADDKKELEEIRKQYVLSLTEICQLSDEQLQEIVFTLDQSAFQNNITLQSVDQFIYFQFTKSKIQSIGQDQSRLFVTIKNKTRKIFMIQQKSQTKLQNQVNISMSQDLLQPVAVIMDRIKQSDDFCSQLVQIIKEKQQKIEKVDSQINKQLSECTNNLSRLIFGYSIELKQIDFSMHNILSYAHINSGKLKINKSNFSIKRLIEDIMLLQRGVIEKQKLSVSTQFVGFNTREGQIKHYSQKQVSTNDQSFMICSEQRRIMQMIFNLLQVSIKMSQPGDSIMFKCHRILQKSKQIKIEKNAHESSKVKVSYGLCINKDQINRNKCTYETEQLINLEREQINSKKHKKRITSINNMDYLNIGAEQGNEMGRGLIQTQDEFENIAKRINEFQFETTRTPSNSNSKIVISVINNSKGFKLNDMCHLWKIIEQQKSERQFKHNWLEPNLVIIDNLATAINGKFGFKSIHRQGSIFEFSIPLNKYDYVSPCFDEDVEINGSSTSGFQFSTISMSDQSFNYNANNFKLPKMGMALESNMNSLELGDSINQKINTLNLDFQNGIGEGSPVKNVVSLSKISSINGQQPNNTTIQKSLQKVNQKIALTQQMAPEHISNTNTSQFQGSLHMSELFTPDTQGLDLKSKILIVDDEKFNCDIIESFLMILGIQNYQQRSEQCYNGDQAVQKIKQAIQDGDPQRYKLILMDCNMPFMDGYDATKSIRRLLKQQGIKIEAQPLIIAVTGHVEEEYVKKATGSGMSKVFPKPFPIKEFGKLLIECKLLATLPKNLRLENDED